MSKEMGIMCLNYQKVFNKIMIIKLQSHEIGEGRCQLG